LGELGTYINGRGFKKSEWGNQGRPIIRIQNLTGTARETNHFDGEVDERHIVRPGDLLVSWAASLGAYIWNGEEGCLNQHIFKVESYIDKRFHYYLLQDILDDLLRKTHGSGMVHITRKRFDETPVAIPDRDEQGRIVAKIEELFSDLDAGVAALKRAQANLTRYRAAALKAAVEGKLTEQWRAENPPSEPASVLLERILAERRKKWEEEQLKKYEAKGKKPSKNWQEKYTEPRAPNTADLPALPESWCWATIDQTCQQVRYGSSSKATRDLNGIPVLRMGNIQEGQLDLTDLKYLPHDHREFPGLLLQPGDLLFNRTNSAELVGKSAVYLRAPEPCSFASYLISARPLSPLDARICCYALNSFWGRQWISSVVSQQVGQANVNGSKLRAFAFPLSPVDEQLPIIEAVEERLSVLEQTRMQIQSDVLRASRLRQGILRRAFEGSLVPSDARTEATRVEVVPAGRRQPEQTQLTLNPQ
jgi:type I restriction enzyme S subunit